MKILALDSSGMVASAAILENDTLVAEYTINHKKTHSQTLLPMIDTIAAMTGTELTSLDAIAVSAGPGSFTGLRIGSATAKGLGLALDKPLISVSTLEALAYNLYGVPGLICPVMDARRDQVYTAVYRFKDDRLETAVGPCAVPVDELLTILARYQEQVTFLGDGVPVYQKQIEEKKTFPVFYAPAHLSRQRAGAVAALAKQYFLEGRTETADEHKPDYLRLSQAERERAERERAEKERAEKEKAGV